MPLDEAAERECIHEWMPHLREVAFEVKSPTDRGYNCVAWAAGDDTKIWSPAVGVGGKMLGGYFWPTSVPKLPTVSVTEMVFELEGFVRTHLDDTAPEEGVEKVAIFGNDDMGLVTHAARQSPSGRWCSKMGDCGDVEHDLRDVEGGLFGELRSVMRKDPIADPAPSAATPALIVVERRTRPDPAEDETTEGPEG